MKKIISLFVRDFKNNPKFVLNEITPGAEWVIAGEGVATEKIDGTSCLFQDGKLFKRYNSKNGKTPPEGFIPAQDPDPITGHWPGWLAIDSNNPSDKWHMEGWKNSENYLFEDKTYELIGPKVQSNPYKEIIHKLVLHGHHTLADPRLLTFDGLKEFLSKYIMEGIVWHHPDGRMVKIKASDFGIKWPR